MKILTRKIMIAESDVSRTIITTSNDITTYNKNKRKNVGELSQITTNKSTAHDVTEHYFI